MKLILAMIKQKIIKSQSGQGVVETLLVTVLFLTAIIFTMVQFTMITLGWMRANDAAQAGVRAAIVTKGNSSAGAEGEDPEQNAQTAITYVLGIGLPAKATIWNKNPLGKAGADHSGNPKQMFSAHAYYTQSVMFSSILQPILGDNDPFIQSEGMAGSFYGGGYGTLDVSRKYGVTGAAHCRMMKSPDWKFYETAYPGAKKFNE
ncbi:MAG: hypothetical protein CVU77_01250 [Elusimicrobia bacterium HGW-Elusimicrobia-1]|jgi:hypothetical protein|nr:MAG: hypothetical protein CVU77_01250 [Elusimicrobia bacterium HGW-Elusimicrobia-1]